jgi:class 3 adenylate cyclase
MIDAAHRYDGYIVQSTGDGIFALFGAPVAHEDHPQRGLYATLRMQDEMRHYSEHLLAHKGTCRCAYDCPSNECGLEGVVQRQTDAARMNSVTLVKDWGRKLSAGCGGPFKAVEHIVHRL